MKSNAANSWLLVHLLLPFLVMLAWLAGTARGIDAHNACSRLYRNSRARNPPCDFKNQNYCTVPGSSYPWQAVRRWVRDNQGLMRRMYGEERHSSVLRAEIHVNDISDLADWTFVEKTKNRYQGPRLQMPVGARPISETPSATPTPMQGHTDPVSTTVFETPTTLEETTMSQMEGANGGGNINLDLEPREGTTESDLSTTEQKTEESASTYGWTETETSIPTAAQTNGSPVTDNATTEASSASSQLFQDVEQQSPTPVLKLRGVNACPVKEEVVAPFWANNTRGEVLALLNVYPFEQYVHWEKCTFEHKQMFCREGCRCEQQYRLHRLLAFDPNNDCRGIFSDWFKFPSCCVCTCYDLSLELRITSRSPRSQVPSWYKPD